MSLKVPVIIALVAICSLPAPAAAAADRCDELWAAGTADDLKRVAELINAGVDVNCRIAGSRETVLMAAAMNGAVDIVKFLLALGADPSLKDAGDNTALDLARSHEAVMSKNPAFANLTRRQRQVIAVLQPLATGPAKPVVPLKVVPTDVGQVARMTLEGARAALSAGLHDSAGASILKVIQMAGVPERWRAHAFMLACDLGMRQRDWVLAKTMCEKVLTFSNADENDRVWSTQTLKDLLKFHPELFKK